MLHSVSGHTACTRTTCHDAEFEDEAEPLEICPFSPGQADAMRLPSYAEGLPPKDQRTSCIRNSHGHPHTQAHEPPILGYTLHGTIRIIRTHARSHSATASTSSSCSFSLVMVMGQALPMAYCHPITNINWHAQDGRFLPGAGPSYA